jgi:lipid A 3-O-deacylase
MKTVFFRSAAACGVLLLAGAVQAMDLKPDAVFAQGGFARNATTTASVGLAWDWDWERLRRHAFVNGSTELFVSHWQARSFVEGYQGFQQVVLLPVLRMRLDQGRSRWYLETGIGASWMNRMYVTPTKQFSTQWNFYDMVGLGYSWGKERQHELALRLVHVSNAGIRDPNPGEDFVLLRYAQRF